LRQRPENIRFVGERGSTGIFSFLSSLPPEKGCVE
jgi:hypothetical protein